MRIHKLGYNRQGPTIVAKAFRSERHDTFQNIFSTATTTGRQPVALGNGCIMYGDRQEWRIGQQDGWTAQPFLPWLARGGATGRGVIQQQSTTSFVSEVSQDQIWYRQTIPSKIEAGQPKGPRVEIYADDLRFFALVSWTTMVMMIVQATAIVQNGPKRRSLRAKNRLLCTSPRCLYW